MNKILYHLLLTLTLLACDGDNDNPANKTSQGMPEQTIDNPDNMHDINFLGLKSKLPANWISEPPTSSMRLAQFIVPAAEFHKTANLILFYFGLGQGGGPAANINRWQSQFSTPQGETVKPKVETLIVSKMPVTVVELTGNYARGVGMGPVGKTVPEQTLLAAIVETPRGNIYVQLHGPSDTVKASRSAYMHFIKSIHTD